MLEYLDIFQLGIFTDPCPSRGIYLRNEATDGGQFPDGEDLVKEAVGLVGMEVTQRSHRFHQGHHLGVKATAIQWQLQDLAARSGAHYTPLNLKLLGLARDRLQNSAQLSGGKYRGCPAILH